MTNEKLNELIAEKLKISAQIKDLKVVEDRIKSDIQYIMESESLESYEDPNESMVTFKTQVRNSLDSAKVKKYFGDSIAEYMKTSSFNILKVITKEERERVKKFITKEDSQ